MSRVRSGFEAQKQKLSNLGDLIPGRVKLVTGMALGASSTLAILLGPPSLGGDSKDPCETNLNAQRVALERRVSDHRPVRAMTKAIKPAILAEHPRAHVEASSSYPDQISTVTAADDPIVLSCGGKAMELAGVDPYAIVPEMPGEAVGFVDAQVADIAAYDANGQRLGGPEDIVNRMVTLRFTLTHVQLMDHPGTHGFEGSDGGTYGIFP